MIQKLPLASTAPVLIVGSVAYDTTITPAATQEYILGGSASYSSIAASYFAPVQLVGVVGNDFKKVFIDRFEHHGIDLQGLKISEQEKTFFWKGRYHENFNQRETLVTELNAFESFEPILPDNYKETAYVMLGTIGPDLQHHVLDQLSGPAYVIADTIELWIDIKRKELEALLPKINLLTIDKREAMMITGESNTICAGHKLREMGPESVILKKGEHGAILFHKDGLFAIPAYPITEIEDPTGAGDTFAGALLGYLAASGNTNFTTLKKAMAYATATASITIQAFSADRLNDAAAVLIEQRVAELKALTQF